MKPIHCYIARLSLQLSLLDFCKLFGLAPAEVRRWEDYAEKTCGPMGTYGRIVYETLLVILRSLKIDQVVVLLLDAKGDQMMCARLLFRLEAKAVNALAPRDKKATRARTFPRARRPEAAVNVRSTRVATPAKARKLLSARLDAVGSSSRDK